MGFICLFPTVNSIGNCNFILHLIFNKNFKKFRDYDLSILLSYGNMIERCSLSMEMYSSGWRGAPAKGLGRETGAGVQISPSPPI